MEPYFCNWFNKRFKHQLPNTDFLQTNLLFTLWKRHLVPPILHCLKALTQRLEIGMFIKPLNLFFYLRDGRSRQCLCTFTKITGPDRVGRSFGGISNPRFQWQIHPLYDSNVKTTKLLSNSISSQPQIKFIVTAKDSGVVIYNLKLWVNCSSPTHIWWLSRELG